MSDIYRSDNRYLIVNYDLSDNLSAGLRWIVRLFNPIKFILIWWNIIWNCINPEVSLSMVENRNFENKSSLDNIPQGQKISENTWMHTTYENKTYGKIRRMIFQAYLKFFNRPLTTSGEFSILPIVIYGFSDLIFCRKSIHENILQSIKWTFWRHLWYRVLSRLGTWSQIITLLTSKCI